MCLESNFNANIHSFSGFSFLHRRSFLQIFFYLFSSFSLFFFSSVSFFLTSSCFSSSLKLSLDMDERVLNKGNYLCLFLSSIGSACCFSSFFFFLFLWSFQIFFSILSYMNSLLSVWKLHEFTFNCDVPKITPNGPDPSNELPIRNL